MAKQSVIEQAEQSEFFSFNGTYQVNPATSQQDLLNDAACWLDGATAIINSMACEVGNVDGQLAANPREVAQMLWGVWHLLNITTGALGAAQLRKVGA